MKFKKFAALLVVALVMTFVFAACGNNSVDGKTYKFDSVSVEWTDTATEEQKSALIAAANVANETELFAYLKEFFSEGMSQSGDITFKDGKVYASGDGNDTEDYTQEGNIVTIGSGEYAVKLTVDGNKLYMDASGMQSILEDYPINVSIVYVQK